MKPVLVTGATGFVGAALVRHLLDGGHRVCVLVRPTSSTRRLDRLDGLDLDRVAGDVTDRESLATAVRGVGAVFHVAGLVSYRRRDLEALQKVNVVGTRNVLDAALAAGVDRVVHTSSVVAVGSAGTQSDPTPIDETAAWDLGADRSGYFDTKHAAEREVARAVERGLDVVIVNPSAVTGAHASRGNLDALLRMIRTRRRAIVPAGGMNMVWNRDVAVGHLLALEKGVRGERYILGAENMTYVELARRLAVMLDIPIQTHVLPRTLTRTVAAIAAAVDRIVELEPPASPETMRAMGRHFWYQHSKAARDLGYAPLSVDIALRESLAC